jgi:phytoene dehydrogenase-like protein
MSSKSSTSSSLSRRTLAASGTFDAIVIGAGHNGLTAAALLAKAGRRVLVLERRELVGGLAASEPFHSGYASAGVLADTCLVRPSVIAALGLAEHGLRLRASAPAVLALGEGGPLWLPQGHDASDVDRAAAAIGRLSPADAEAYRGYVAQLERLAPAVRELLDRAPIDVVDVESESLWGLLQRALRVRRLADADLMELLRLPPMCVGDVLRERFASDRVSAALALPALAGTFTGPWSPGNGLELLRRASLMGAGVVGGGPMLVDALTRAARAAGAEIHTSAAVTRLLVGRSGIEGVVIAGGEEIRAPLVAASCHPWNTFCELAPPGVLGERLEHRIRTFRSRGCVAQVLLALDRAPRFGGGEPAEFVRTAGHLDEIERAFDAIKYGEVPQSPVLDVHVPTVARPDLAPTGHAVVSALVYYVPYARRGGWDDAARERLGDRVVEILGRHDGGLPGSVVGRKVLVPVDLERQYGLHGGHLHHGEHALDQLLVRPTPECVRYRTPIPGLWLCGSGSHPGGGITCAPGELAAKAVVAGK